jgi:aminoglycoside phosphotransferase (APT) family kinase protein
MIKFETDDLQARLDEFNDLLNHLHQIPVIRNGQGSGHLSQAQNLCKQNIRWLDNVLNKNYKKTKQYLAAMERQAKKEHLEALDAVKKGQGQALREYKAKQKQQTPPEVPPSDTQ